MSSAAPGAVRAARARAAGGVRGRGGKGAAPRGGGAGGRVAESAERREARTGLEGLHTQSVKLCERKLGPEREGLKEEGEARRLETPPDVDSKRSNSRVGGAPGLSPGEVSCRPTRAWYFPKMC